MSDERFPLYRHGDVLVQRIDAIPAGAREVPGTVLARGELTGHSHRIAEGDGRASLLRAGADLFLRVERTATLVHDEHRPIELEPGLYRVWRQREYVPESASDPQRVRFRPVRD